MPELQAAAHNKSIAQTQFISYWGARGTEGGGNVVDNPLGGQGHAGLKGPDPEGSLGPGQSAVSYSFPLLHPGSAETHNEQGFSGYVYSPKGLSSLFEVPAAGGGDASGGGGAGQMLPTGKKGPTNPNTFEEETEGHASRFTRQYGPVNGSQVVDDGTLLGDIAVNMLGKNEFWASGADHTQSGFKESPVAEAIQKTITHTYSGADIVRSTRDTSVVPSGGIGAGQIVASGGPSIGYQYGNQYDWYGNIQGGVERINAPNDIQRTGLQYIPGMRTVGDDGTGTEEVRTVLDGGD